VIEAVIRASAFYLTEPLTKELIEENDVELDEFVEDHLWQPFENWTSNNILSEIHGLASSFEELMRQIPKE
jgi:hypothetical protein